MFIMNIKRILLSILFFAMSGAIYAQKDTTKKQVIDIISSFKPVISNTPKVNFSATYLTADTSKYIAPYSIPSLNLFFSYQPVSLKPLALNKDSVLHLGLRNFLKVGYGNLSSPFASTSFSLGDGIKSLVNLSANYIALKGAIENQNYAQLNAKISGSYFTNTDEIFGSLGFNQQDYHFYGYDHSLVSFSEQDVLQHFDNFQGLVGFRNKVSNDLGITYSPLVDFNVFNNLHKLGENSIRIDVPVEKSLDDLFSVKLSVKADINSYTSKNSIDHIQFNNSIFQLSPEAIYHSKSMLIHGGLTPAWVEGKFFLLPNFYGEANVTNLDLILQAGYTGQFISNSYRNLSVINPYLHSLSFQRNTKETEGYVGFKSSAGKHFNFSAKISLINFNHLPLYINDSSSDNKAFLIGYESSVNNFRFHGDVSFVNSDQFSLTSGITFNGYNQLKDNQKAWGTIPLEIINSLRWQATTQLKIKTDCKIFSGGPYLLKNNDQQNLSNGADLSVGAEFAINKNFSAWLDGNNLLNNKYERWHNYPVYGIHIIGGLIIKF